MIFLFERITVTRVCIISWGCGPLKKLGWEEVRVLQAARLLAADDPSVNALPRLKTFVLMLHLETQLA